MTTFREAVLAKSTAPGGSTLRVHMKSQSPGGGSCDGDIYLGTPLTAAINTNLSALIEITELSAVIEHNLTAVTSKTELTAETSQELTAEILCQQ